MYLSVFGDTFMQKEGQFKHEQPFIRFIMSNKKLWYIKMSLSKLYIHMICWSGLFKLIP